MTLLFTIRHVACPTIYHPMNAVSIKHRRTYTCAQERLNNFWVLGCWYHCRAQLLSEKGAACMVSRKKFKKEYLIPYPAQWHNQFSDQLCVVVLLEPGRFFEKEERKKKKEGISYISSLYLKRGKFALATKKAKKNSLKKKWWFHLPRKGKGSDWFLFSQIGSKINTGNRKKGKSGRSRRFKHSKACLWGEGGNFSQCRGAAVKTSSELTEKTEEKEKATSS